MRDRDGKARLGGMAGWDRKQRRDAGLIKPMQLDPQSRLSVTARGYSCRNYTKDGNFLLMSINVRTCSRRKYERKSMQIIRGDYVNLLQNEKKKPIRNRAQS